MSGFQCVHVCVIAPKLNITHLVQGLTLYMSSGKVSFLHLVVENEANVTLNMPQLSDY